MMAPVMISPDWVSSAAPTWNLEYGAIARFRAWAAALTSRALLIFAISPCEVFEQMRCQSFDLFCVLQYVLVR